MKKAEVQVTSSSLEPLARRVVYSFAPSAQLPKQRKAFALLFAPLARPPDFYPLTRAVAAPNLDAEGLSLLPHCVAY